MPSFFPDPNLDFEQGLVAVGGELSPELLLEAYGKGIFPWPQEGYPMLWFCPDKRGVLNFADFKIPQRLQGSMKNYAKIKITRNENFEFVIQSCAKQKRANQSGTWINDEMMEAYTELSRMDIAQSWEVWDEGEIVGGGYGVFVRGIFSGESLFHHKTDMSKLALIRMVEDLKLLGCEWMDTQMVTPLLASFGAIEIPKLDYLKRLKADQKPSQKGPKRNHG